MQNRGAKPPYPKQLVAAEKVIWQRGPPASSILALMITPPDSLDMDTKMVQMVPALQEVKVMGVEEVR